MNNGLAGPNTTDTVTGGKTLELSKYDKARRPHKAITDQTKIKVTARTLSTELCCPICLDLLTCTMTTKECLHRFCSECITTALMRGNKECPTCRKKIVSKRSLRPDPNFDFLISKIWPDRKLYDAELNASMQLFKEQSNVAALQKSIEEGIRAQAAYRKQRVQGSYDYEKRKRRPPKLIGPSANAGSCSSSAIAESGEQNAPTESGELVEQVVVALTPVEGLEANSPGAAELARQHSHSTSNLASSSSDDSDSSIDSSSDDSSDLSSDSSMSDSSSEMSNPSTVRSVANDPNLNGHGQQREASALPASRNSPTSPTEESIESQMSIEMAAEQMRRQNEEVELELAPSRAMLARQGQAILAPLNCSHFIRAPSEMTMAHLSEFLFQISRQQIAQQTKEEGQGSAGGEQGPQHTQEQTLASRPENFYILDRRHQLRKLGPQEMLCDAFLLSIQWDRHLVIFFDLNTNDNEKKNIGEVIGEELAKMVGRGELTPKMEENEKEMGEEKEEGEQRRKMVKREVEEEMKVAKMETD